MQPNEGVRACPRCGGDADLQAPSPAAPEASGQNILHTRHRKSETPFVWKMPPNIHWTTLVKIHWKSHNPFEIPLTSETPLENATENPLEHAAENPR